LTASDIEDGSAQKEEEEEPQENHPCNKRLESEEDASPCVQQTSKLFGSNSRLDGSDSGLNDASIFDEITTLPIPVLPAEAASGLPDRLNESVLKTPVNNSFLTEKIKKNPPTLARKVWSGVTDGVGKMFASFLSISRQAATATDDEEFFDNPQEAESSKSPLRRLDKGDKEENVTVAESIERTIYYEAEAEEKESDEDSEEGEGDNTQIEAEKTLVAEEEEGCDRDSKTPEKETVN